MSRVRKAEASTQHEVEAHRAEDCGCERDVCREPRVQQHRENNKVHDRSHGSDGEELGQLAPRAVLEHIQAPEVLDIQELLFESQLAFTVDAILEVDRDFDHALAETPDYQLESNLVADRIERSASLERR